MIALDRQRSVPPQVYDLLREKIQLAELKPGQSVNERWLAEWLGVSRTPIREAIRRLSGEGLIDIVPHVGTSVALVDRAKVYECCVIRKNLECAAVEQATSAFTPAAGRELERLIAEQEETISTGDLARNIFVDSQFHHFIHALSRFQIMTDVLRRVMGEIVRVRHLSIKLPGRLHAPIDEHRRIVRAMQSGNAKAASGAMAEHLDLSIASVLEAMNANSEFLRPGDTR
jgi:GntR family transcriptional regulator, rspAB operon transcriptional repressor